jgi:hypothetical protein
LEAKLGRAPVRICCMRAGVTVKLSAADRQQLAAIAADRNSPQKYIWRAQIVLLAADGCGTAEIMRRHRHEQDGSLALAGTLHDGWGRRPAALQDPPVAHPPLGAEVEHRVVARGGAPQVQGAILTVMQNG